MIVKRDRVEAAERMAMIEFALAQLPEKERGKIEELARIMVEKEKKALVKVQFSRAMALETIFEVGRVLNGGK